MWHLIPKSTRVFSNVAFSTLFHFKIQRSERFSPADGTTTSTYASSLPDLYPLNFVFWVRKACNMYELSTLRLLVVVHILGNIPMSHRKIIRVSDARQYPFQFLMERLRLAVVHFAYFKADAFGIFQLVSCVSSRNSYIGYTHADEHTRLNSSWPQQIEYYTHEN